MRSPQCQHCRPVLADQLALTPDSAGHQPAPAAADVSSALQHHRLLPLHKEAAAEGKEPHKGGGQQRDNKGGEDEWTTTLRPGGGTRERKERRS